MFPFRVFLLIPVVDATIPFLSPIYYSRTHSRSRNLVKRSFVIYNGQTRARVCVCVDGREEEKACVCQVRQKKKKKKLSVY